MQIKFIYNSTSCKLHLNKKQIDERTSQTFDWLIEKIHNDSKKGPIDPSKTELNDFYDRIDRLIEISSSHAITSLHADNLRDLGGYETSFGKRIRKNKILCLFYLFLNYRKRVYRNNRPLSLFLKFP